MFSRRLMPAVVSPAVDLDVLIAAVNTLTGQGSDAVLVDRISQLEHVKASCAAAQAVLTDALRTGLECSRFCGLEIKPQARLDV